MKKILETKTAMVIVFLSISSAFLAGGFIAWLGTVYASPHQKLITFASFIVGQSLMVIPLICYLKYKNFPILSSIRFNTIKFCTIKYVSLFSIGMIMIFPLLLISTVISDRIGYYLMPAQIMILSRLQFLESRYRQLFYVGGILVLSLTFIIWTQASYHFNECYLPYKNILIK